MAAQRVGAAELTASSSHLCTALVKGKRTECQRPVAEGSALSLCLLHLLMAHQEVQHRGGARAVGDEILRTQGAGWDPYEDLREKQAEDDGRRPYGGGE